MSQSMLLFFSLCAGLSFALAYVVIFPWIKGVSHNDNRLMAVNVETFYERLDELESDKKAGVISQEFYDAQVIDLKRQLLAAQSASPIVRPASIKSRLIVMVWIPILVAMVYFLGQDRTAVMTYWIGQDKVGVVADELMSGKIDTPPKWATEDSTALISAMQTNVYRHADDPNRWMRLSELFVALEATPQALEALARAYRLNPDDDAIASTYAQMSFFANNGTLDNTARQVIASILSKNPNHEGALMLMAMGETRAGNFDKARLWVSRLRSNIAAKSGDHSAALASLDEMSKTIDEQAAKATQGVTVNVAIDSQYLGKINPEDVLFVSVVDGAGGAPYAVARVPVSDIKDSKVSLKLSDANAMMPTRTLSSAYSTGAKLVLHARISHSGNAVSQSGDLTSAPAVLDSKTQSVDVIINQIVP